MQVTRPNAWIFDALGEREFEGLSMGRPRQLISMTGDFEGKIASQKILRS